MKSEFYQLISYFLFGGEKPVISDWQAVFTEFAAHAILPLAGTANRIQNYDNIPDPIRTVWVQAIKNEIRSFFAIRSEGKQLTDLLTANGTMPVILKGASAGIYYPDPLFRTYGDIDFIVRGSLDADAAYSFLLDKGYEVNGQNSNPDARHLALKKGGVPLELHRFFSEKKTPGDEALDLLLAQSEPVRRGDFYSPDDGMNGLLFLSHLKMHLCSTGVGMRQVVDFLCFADKVLTDAYWEETFRNLTEKTGLKAFAVHTVRMCELYFGLKHHAFAEEADDEVCRLMMEEIQSAGNFGQKRSSVDNRIAAFSNSNPFVRLQRLGLSNWKAAQKHKWLRPFAWLYQVFRILGILIRSLFQGKTIAGGLKQGRRIGYLKKKLKLK